MLVLYDGCILACLELSNIFIGKGVGSGVQAITAADNVNTLIAQAFYRTCVHSSCDCCTGPLAVLQLHFVYCRRRARRKGQNRYLCLTASSPWLQPGRAQQQGLLVSGAGGTQTAWLWCSSLVNPPPYYTSCVFLLTMISQIRASILGDRATFQY